MCGIDARVDNPLQDRLGYKLRAVVATQIARCTVDADHSRKHVDDTRAANGARHINRQALPGVFIDEREALELLTIGAGIEDKVIGPDVILISR